MSGRDIIGLVEIGFGKILVYFLFLCMFLKIRKLCLFGEGFMVFILIFIREFMR